jgi:hypothetical protein
MLNIEKGDIFAEIVGWRASGAPGSMRQKRELAIFARKLEVGNAYVELQSQGRIPVTAHEIHEYLEQRYSLREIHAHLCDGEIQRYLAVPPRDGSVYWRGKRWLREQQQGRKVDR